MSKTKEKAVSDEQIISALLSLGTVQEAADVLQISPRTIYDRRRNADFQAAYQDAKNEVIRKAVYEINRRLSEAVETVTGIMNDQNVNAATRLQAAQTILNNAQKFSERLSRDEMASRTAHDPWDILGVDL